MDSDCQDCKVIPLWTSLEVCYHNQRFDIGQKYKEKLKFASSDISSQMITKIKVKHQWQKRVWLNTQGLSHANLCVKLTSALILVSSRKLAFITVCRYVKSRYLNYRSAIVINFFFLCLPEIKPSSKPRALK